MASGLVVLLAERGEHDAELGGGKPELAPDLTRRRRDVDAVDVRNELHQAEQRQDNRRGGGTFHSSGEHLRDVERRQYHSRAQLLIVNAVWVPIKDSAAVEQSLEVLSSEAIGKASEDLSAVRTRIDEERFEIASRQYLRESWGCPAGGTRRRSSAAG
jgi:hypothetical protein